MVSVTFGEGVSRPGLRFLSEEIIPNTAVSGVFTCGGEFRIFPHGHLDPEPIVSLIMLYNSNLIFADYKNKVLKTCIHNCFINF